MFVRQIKLLLVSFCMVFSPVSASFVCAEDFDTVQIQTEKITDGIYMFVGKGGNIGLSAGDDGVFLIDDQFAPLTDKIKNAIAAISDKPIRFVLNTHWHFDHTGGNENLGETGSVIVAHENVRKRLSSEQFIEFFHKKIPPLAKAGLPVITFTKDLTFHLNGDGIYVFHVRNAHTDGDTIVYFRKANVVHMGDTYFSGMYPFIDLSTGGSVNGVIEAVSQVLAMTNEATKVIPGHGPLSDRKELRVYRNMLTALRDRVGTYIRSGKTLDEVLALNPARDFDAEWNKGIITSDQFIQILYKDLLKYQETVTPMLERDGKWRVLGSFIK